MSSALSTTALGWLVLALGCAAACGSRSSVAGAPEAAAGSPGTSDAGGMAGGDSAGAPWKPRPAHSGGSTNGAGGRGGDSAQGGAQPSGGGNEGGEPGHDAGASSGGSPDSPRCEPIVFDDPELERHVALSVGKASGPLTAADVAGLKALSTNRARSLKGVECLVHLTDLDVGVQPAGQVEDLSPLASLHELEAVSVGRNPLKSLAPLGELPKLVYLFVAHAPVTLELEPLATAPALVYLDLEGDTVADLAPLGAVTTLRTLKLRQGHVLRPNGTAALTNVRDFDATAVFDDVSPLAGLVQLERLRVSQRVISGFDQLAGLTNLRLLDITRTGIEDLQPVSGMARLTILNAVGNQISDVSPLGALLSLQSVALASNRINDVSALAGNAGLGTGDTIYLDDNELGCQAQKPQLQALRDRGAVVESDCD